MLKSFPISSGGNYYPSDESHFESNIEFLFDNVFCFGNAVFLYSTFLEGPSLSIFSTLKVLVKTMLKPLLNRQ